MTEPTAPKMKKCFQTGGGFAVWVPDVPEETATPAVAPAETVAATGNDEEVPPEGDCDGCARKPSNQPPSVP